MKKENNLSIKTRNLLGKKIDDYIRSKGITQSQFAKQIDLVLYKDYNEKKDKFEDKPTDNKAVSRWINADVFPSLPNLIAISKIINLSLDELLLEETTNTSKTKGLSNEERFALEILLSEKNEDGTASLYAPLSFNDENLDFKYFYLRHEVVELYKEKTLKAFNLSRLEDFAENLKEVDLGVMKKYFSKFTSSIVLEEGLTDTYGPIYFDNTDECYKKLQQVWKATNDYTVYNALFFTEKTFIMSKDENEEYGKEFLGKDSYYKNITKINEKYDKSFANLIEKGIISPVKDSFEKSEFDNGKYLPLKSLNSNQFTEFCILDNNNEPTCDYTLSALKFNFKINLSKSDLKQFDKENLERKYN